MRSPNIKKREAIYEMAEDEKKILAVLDKADMYIL